MEGHSCLFSVFGKKKSVKSEESVLMNWNVSSDSGLHCCLQFQVSLLSYRKFYCERTSSVFSCNFTLQPADGDISCCSSVGQFRRRRRRRRRRSSSSRIHEQSFIWSSWCAAALLERWNFYEISSLWIFRFSFRLDFIGCLTSRRLS